jgi:mRNA interferase MazF
MNYAQGNIVLIPVPFSDLSSTKPRPAVIISHPKSSSFGNHLFAKITSNLRDDQCSFPIREDEITDK